MKKPLGEEYFTRYGAHTPGLEKKDYSRNWRIYTFSIPEILRIYRSRFDGAPKTFLDLGAADGSLMKKALQRGLKVRGVENSEYILARIRDPKIRARIKKADADQEIRNIRSDSFDVVVECVAQYLAPRARDRYLKQVRRVCPGMVCLLVDAKSYNGIRGTAHTGVRTFETKTWWRKKMFSLGFKRCEDDFYFFRD